MSKKCPRCELVNWEQEEVCKRCGASLNVATPPIFKWYVVYCVFMALLYLGIGVTGITFMFMEPEGNMSAAEQTAMGAVVLMMGVVFGVPYAIAPFLERKSWVWVYGLALICIGLSSICCLPVCIPLLIAWLKPDMKAYYGRIENPLSPPLPPQWN